MFLVLQYHGQSDKYSDALDYLNMIFTGVFTVEFLLKLAAFRFKVTLELRWCGCLNCLDFKQHTDRDCLAQTTHIEAH